MRTRYGLAMYILAVSQKYYKRWIRLSNKQAGEKLKRQARRHAIKVKTEGLILHDRILIGRSIKE